MLRGGGGEAQGFREFSDEVVIDCVFWFVGCLNCGHFYGWGVERIPGWRGECLGKNVETKTGIAKRFTTYIPPFKCLF